MANPLTAILYDTAGSLALLLEQTTEPEDIGVLDSYVAHLEKVVLALQQNGSPVPTVVTSVIAAYHAANAALDAADRAECH